MDFIIDENTYTLCPESPRTPFKDEITIVTVCCLKYNDLYRIKSYTTFPCDILCIYSLLYPYGHYEVCVKKLVISTRPNPTVRTSLFFNLFVGMDPFLNLYTIHVCCNVLSGSITFIAKGPLMGHTIGKE